MIARRVQRPIVRPVQRARNQWTAGHAERVARAQWGRQQYQSAVGSTNSFATTTTVLQTVEQYRVLTSFAFKVQEDCAGLGFHFYLKVVPRHWSSTEVHAYDPYVVYGVGQDAYLDVPLDYLIPGRGWRVWLDMANYEFIKIVWSCMLGYRDIESDEDMADPMQLGLGRFG